MIILGGKSKAFGHKWRNRYTSETKPQLIYNRTRMDADDNVDITSFY